MTDLHEFEDTVRVLKESFDDVHYRRPAPKPEQPSGVPAWVTAAAVMILLSGGLWLMLGRDTAAWAESGRQPTSSESAWMTDQCADLLADTPSIPIETLPALMTAEVRGHTAVFVYADNTSYVTCFARDITADEDERLVEVMTAGNREDLSNGSDQLRFDAVTIGPPQDSQGRADTLITGVVGDQIETVVIKTPTLGEFEATVSNGWFTAWWPTTETFEVVALDATGGTVASYEMS